nr:MAG: putative transmembrane protein [Polycipiviridae sp.]
MDVEMGFQSMPELFQTTQLGMYLVMYCFRVVLTCLHLATRIILPISRRLVARLTRHLLVSLRAPGSRDIFKEQRLPHLPSQTTVEIEEICHQDIIKSQ